MEIMHAYCKKTQITQEIERRALLRAPVTHKSCCWLSSVFPGLSRLLFCVLMCVPSVFIRTVDSKVSHVLKVGGIGALSPWACTWVALLSTGSVLRPCQKPLPSMEVFILLSSTFLIKQTFPQVSSFRTDLPSLWRRCSSARPGSQPCPVSV